MVKIKCTVQLSELVNSVFNSPPNILVSIIFEEVKCLCKSCQVFAVEILTDFAEITFVVSNEF